MLIPPSELLANLLISLFSLCGVGVDVKLEWCFRIYCLIQRVLNWLVLTYYLPWQVFAGAKPLLDKTLGILVEGLIDTFLSLFHENKSKDLRTLDANGFCQLMLEVWCGFPMRGRIKGEKKRKIAAVVAEQFLFKDLVNQVQLKLHNVSDNKLFRYLFLCSKQYVF